MVLSNEPGVYKDGCYGIRCENLVAVREARDLPGEKSMLEFETLTLVPFDRRLLAPELLTLEELQRIKRHRYED